VNKLEAVKQARDKWENVLGVMEDLQAAVFVPCSFCEYYHDDCDVCPLGKGDDGEELGCQDYMAVSDSMGIITKHSQEILRDIAKVADEPCRHERDVEVTTRTDIHRVYHCMDCGDKREEAFTVGPEEK